MSRKFPHDRHRDIKVQNAGDGVLFTHHRRTKVSLRLLEGAKE